MSSLLGGYYCPGTYKSGGLFGDDYCSKNFNEDASCNGANDYCGQLSSCTFIYTY